LERLGLPPPEMLLIPQINYFYSKGLAALPLTADSQASSAHLFNPLPLRRDN